MALTLASLQMRVMHLDDSRYRGAERPTESINMIVTHSTAGYSAADAMAWDNRPNSETPASYHYIVSRDGTICRTTPVNLVAWHAGASEWPITSKLIPKTHSVNRRSVGIALAGDIDTDRHTFERVTRAQLESAYWLHRVVMQQYDIAVTRVRGHREVAPGRKQDPRPDFLSMPWWRAVLSAPPVSYEALWDLYAGRVQMAA
jgi:N-acetylmuramoyl-L-alanine amidase